MPPARANRAPNASAGLVWLRRDLRLADNPAFAAAAHAGSPVVAAYLHAPEEEGNSAAGAASRWWLYHSLAAMDAALHRCGNGLVLRRGPTLPALVELARETGARIVHWNRVYEPAFAAHDEIVRAGLERAGIEARIHESALLVPPTSALNAAGQPYRVFTPFWRRCAGLLDTVGSPLPAPQRLPRVQPAPFSLSLSDLGLLPAVRWDEGLAAAWEPGESSALRRLARFKSTALARYQEARDRPAVSGTSRLSPHLHFGELSPRQVLAALRSGTANGRDAFLRQLGWREFAAHLLHHFPHTADQPLDERFAGLRWRKPRAEVEAWQRGQTGFPMVDAGMRELWRTGWMHNRARMIVASLLTKNLFIDWREGARWFLDTLVDADLANNTLGWQWTAGCGADAAPWFRIFNPVLQARKFDRDGSYIRRWVPELAQLPERWLPEPWSAPPAVLAAAGVTLGRTYPRPIVDLAESRKRALRLFAGLARPA